MVDIDTGIGIRTGGPTVRRVPRQPEAEPASDPVGEPEVRLKRRLEPRTRARTTPPQLPDLPQLPELLDLPELVRGHDCNPLADRQVAVVGIHYAPEPTGVAPYTTAMAEHLATKAARVTVLTGLPHYPSWRVPHAYRGFGRTPELHSPTLHVMRHAHTVPRRFSALSGALYQATFAVRASRTRLAERPDLVLAVTPSASSAIAGARLAERHGCPLIVVVQDLVATPGRLSHDRGTGAMVAGPPSGITARLEASALRRADRVVIQSEAMVAAVMACGVPQNRIDTVPVWPTAQPSGLDRAEARRRLGWARDRFTVVHCGDIGAAQGLDTVVDAACELNRRGIQVSFVLAGDGTHRRQLADRVSGLRPGRRGFRGGELRPAGNVRLIDRVAVDETATMLAAADLLVISERPGVGVGWLPGVIPAYLTAGRPVVGAVSALGVVGRELVRSRAARLVEPGHVHGLADAIAELSRSEKKRAQLAAAAVGYAGRAYDRATSMRELETTVARVLAGI